MPRRGARTFVDSGTVLSTSYRLPLLVCAQRHYLAVAWSPYVAAEVARVATREWVKAAIKRAADQGSDEIGRTVIDSMETVRSGIDKAVSALEQSWSCPSADALELATGLISPLQDEKDWPVLAGAVAAGAQYLLSLDQRSFPHGRGWRNVVFWHPDTFLTTFFQVDAEAYVDVRLDLADIPQPIPLVPR